MLNALDSTDIRILQLLQENARLTNKEIGEKLHKTASPINDRIRKLQDQGYIKKYVAVLDRKKIGRGLMAFTHVQLRDHNRESLNHFESEIIKFPEVLECYHMSGQYDFILRVAVKDLDAYHEFLMNHIFETIPMGSVQSTFVMKEAKAETAFQIGELNGKSKK
ncbi:Lrp/AsnC family transcriptional regulator [Mucilaginibacter paludis]|uniref:Transcriptional regulator, AsnC family n=1 Tax=Mucilaginibacter paludis DSM 18603 TaxID=714943 RepID=H1YCY4_9SPHI|nr:Lrp/AsnC family transcriptional regulator [Mucilaginibacter paludis]EHQ25155.1 transcriptional regulator, AsnC family [Mucilaginibacter paludis DSM 18603]